MKILSTERLLLRWLDSTDQDFIITLLNDRSFLDNIGDRGVRTKEDALRYIEKMQDTYRKQGFGFYLVETHAKEKLGISGMIHRPGLSDPDIGFAFLPQHHGKGFARESAEAVKKMAIKEFQLNRLVAITSPENKDSIRLLGKLGLVFEKNICLPGDTKVVALFAWEKKE